MFDFFVYISKNQCPDQIRFDHISTENFLKDIAFHEEIQGLRDQGRHVCEATNEAVSAPYRKSPIALDLMRACLAQASSASSSLM